MSIDTLSYEFSYPFLRQEKLCRRKGEENSTIQGTMPHYAHLFLPLLLLALLYGLVVYFLPSFTPQPIYAITAYLLQHNHALFAFLLLLIYHIGINGLFTPLTVLQGSIGVGITIFILRYLHRRSPFSEAANIFLLASLCSLLEALFYPLSSPPLLLLFTGEASPIKYLQPTLRDGCFALVWILLLRFLTQLLFPSRSWLPSRDWWNRFRR